MMKVHYTSSPFKKTTCGRPLRLGMSTAFEGVERVTCRKCQKLIVKAWGWEQLKDPWGKG